MDALRSRSNYPSAWHPIEYFKFKKNFQPKPAPPRKKPANSFLQLCPAKFTEAFGLTISPPTLSLGNGENFTFCDGEWRRPYPKSKRQSRNSQIRNSQSRNDQSKNNLARNSQSRNSQARKNRSVDFEEKCHILENSAKNRPRPPVNYENRFGIGSSENPDFQKKICFQDLERELAHCKKKLKEKNEKEKEKLEKIHRKKMQDCERCHRETEEAMRREHEAKIDAQKSQIDALLIKCNELKGENNLLQIKISKMMDMLAECAAEVNLQEAELAQVAHTLQKKKKKPEPEYCLTFDEENDQD